MSEENKLPKWTETTIQLKTGSESEIKEVSAPAIVNELAPGLAVTMTSFGWFNVTHIPTGRSMSSTYERYCSAMLTLTEYAMAAIHFGFRWDDKNLNIPALLERHGNKPVPFGGNYSIGKDNIKKPISFGEYIYSSTNDFFCDEFPWEGESPFDSAHELLKKIQASGQRDNVL